MLRGVLRGFYGAVTWGSEVCYQNLSGALVAKLTGWRQWAAIRDLAEGKSQRAVAAMYGVSQPTVHSFAEDHREAIEATRAELHEAYAGLWAADKAKRIAAYQQDVDDIDAEREELGRLLGVDARRVRQAALRAMADEMGQLPQRIHVEGGKEPVRHVIEGISLEDLS